VVPACCEILNSQKSLADGCGSSDRKIKGVREPSEEENSRDLEVRRFAPVFLSWLEAVTRNGNGKVHGCRVSR
jgi:hypothetical protein